MFACLTHRESDRRGELFGMKKKRRRRPNSGFLGVQDSRRPLFVVDLKGEGESSALPFTGLVGEREGESGSAEGIVLMPGCYDALSAAIVQKSGFSAGLISGYALSASLLGKPDFGLLTQPEMAEKARFICASAPNIPIIADAGERRKLRRSRSEPPPLVPSLYTGGGNALNVQRTVQDLIAAGAAGCFLELHKWMRMRLFTT